jgi:hypothetical protein
MLTGFLGGGVSIEADSRLKKHFCCHFFGYFSLEICLPESESPRLSIIPNHSLWVAASNFVWGW